jgi:hypothetical protein
MPINPEGELITTQPLNINVGDAVIRARSRAFNEGSAGGIAESTQDIGLINLIPIDSVFNLIAGFHHLQAHVY